ncbi:hypothetical protein HDA32_005091 [Spinactinospora alkalitolerans]|uniref:NERD domain-containing protein n=1 Tax=Spinactinospora alkalitolerans TaxID=687207 RepID=A0A852U1G4_9ACTN|nr:hypothetical protein [Spinactinospora alkalitolerans]NYE49971.1 hypothetical protein [Spinactinospora alkalitolerans]
MGDGGPIRPGRPTAASGSIGARSARFAVRVLVVLAAGVMGAGFLGWRAGILVAALAALTYLLLATVAPRVPAPYGRGRLLRALQRQGYHVVPVVMSRHLAVGPGGVYLLETRIWRHAVSREDDDWRIGAVPAARAMERLVGHANRVDRALRLSEDRPGVTVVPVIAVAGRLPEPVMRSGRAIIARPRSAVRYILERPEVLRVEEVDEITEAAIERLAEE